MELNPDIRDIAARYNAEHRADYGRPVKNQRIGYIPRSHLDIKPRKSNGICVVPNSERNKLAAIARRFGIVSAGTAERAAQPEAFVR